MKEIFTPIKPKRIADEIAAQIQSLILRGVLQPGQKLPPERELAQWLNVSRTSLRDALNDLQGRGLVETQRGNRTFVRPITTRSVYDPFVAFLKDSPENILKLFEVRKHLEIGAALLLAQRAGDDEIELLEKQLLVMQDDIRKNRLGARSGIEFHILLAKAAHNELHLHLINTFFDLLQEPFRKAWGEMFKDRQGWNKDLKQHKAIVGAIKERDVAATETAVREHLEYGEEIWRHALDIV